MNKRQRKKHILREAVLLTCGVGDPQGMGALGGVYGDVYVDIATCAAWWFSPKGKWQVVTRRWQAYERIMGKRPRGQV